MVHEFWRGAGDPVEVAPNTTDDLTHQKPADHQKKVDDQKMGDRQKMGDHSLTDADHLWADPNTTDDQKPTDRQKKVDDQNHPMKQVDDQMSADSSNWDDQNSAKSVSRYFRKRVSPMASKFHPILDSRNWMN